MERCSLLAALLAAFTVTTVTTTYGSQRPAAPQPQPELLDIVEVVGCLTAGPNGTWVMSSATAPGIINRPYTTAEGLKAAAAKPLGKGQVRLLNAAPFNPEAHKGHKMAARGVLIKDPKENRVNLTSLQMLDATCAK